MNFSKNKSKLICLTSILLIILVAFALGTLFDSNEVAQSAVISNADVLSSDLLLSTRTSTAVGGTVFSGDALDALYKKLAGSNATFATVESKARAAKSTYNANNVMSIHSGMDSYDIRNQNGGKNIVVTLGGKQWIVTALTTGCGNGYNQDIIITLLLKDRAFNSKWSGWMPTNPNNYSQTYPATMYSTSYIRAALLDGTTQYANAATTLTSLTNNDKTSLYGSATGYPFSIFTKSSAAGSITNFLVAPNQVLYQRYENLNDIDAAQGVNSNSWKTAPNDNTGVNIVSSKWNTNVNNVQSNTHYYDWCGDLLWLPSIAEMGQKQRTNINRSPGLWNLDDGQRGISSGYNSQLRSGMMNSSAAVVCLDENGCSSIADTNATVSSAASVNGFTPGTLSVRPAIHLNLTNANKSALISLKAPSNVTTDYNGEQQDYFKAKGGNVDWYDATAYSSANANVKVEYFYENNTQLPTSDKPINYGKYKVKLTIQNTAKYQWVGGGSVKEITYQIDKLGLTVNFNTNVSPPTATPTNLCKVDESLKDDILKIRYNTVGLTDYVYDYPTKIGTYTVAVELNEEVTTNYKLATDYTATISVTTEGVPVPKVTSDTISFNGTLQGYMLQYDKSKVNLEIADAYKGSGAFDFDGDFISVTNAGKYKDALKATLLDPYNPSDKTGSYVWKGTTTDTAPRYVSFVVDSMNLAVSTTQTEITVQQGETYTLDIMTTNRPFDGVSLTVNVTGQIGATSPRTIGHFTLSKTDPISDNVTVTLDMSALLVTGDYTIGFETDDSNYAVSFTAPVILHLVTKIDTPTLIWRLKEDGVITANSVNAEIGKDTEVDYNITDLVYNGKEYSFYAQGINGYAVDEDYTVGEFVNGYANEKATNAGAYTTRVAVIQIGDTSTRTIYTINWEIEKALFDLSSVKWKGDGAIEYAGKEVEITLENLPGDLKAEDIRYGNNKDTSVGPKGTAIVTFVLTGDALRNYKVPEQGGNGVNYKYVGVGNDFEWEKDWKIVKAKLGIGSRNDWETAPYTNNDGNTFDYYKLVDTRADGVVEYEYYETDNTGKILDSAAAISSLEELKYSATVKKYYKALPKILDTDNYQFADGATDLYSPFFTVGGGASQVSVSIALEYNGKPRNVKLVISGSGATLNDFDITYYTGDVVDEAHRLSQVPTDKGNYLAVITSNKSSVVIDGKNQYTFEIISATLKKDWNKDAKPYVLKLKYGQIDGVEYVMADENGNIVEYSNLTAGNKYQIKAVIKDNMRGNYSFADGTYETDWEEFELREEDMANLQDPNDPNNMHYPQGEDEDPSNPDDNTPSGEPSGDIGSGDNNGGGALDDILEKLKDVPLWQLIASVISIILIIIFLSKTAKYAGERKKYKKKSDKLETMFAITFLGLAFTAWTAIACVLMALAVVSLIIMLIAKSRLRKAKEEYEDILEEYNRNQKDLEDRKKAEEKEEARQRQEDMKMMFMSMMGGNNGGNASQGMPQGGYAYAGTGIGAEEIRGIISETVAALLPGVQQLLPQQASTNDEIVQRLIEKSKHNDETMRELLDRNDEAIKDMIERNDEKIQDLMEKNDERIERLMDKIMELSANQNTQPQIVEKVVEKEVPVEVEKIVEKEVIKEVPVEKVVEKIVEKEVKVPVAAPAKPKKEVAPRLTLDEAYALLSKQQKKYFDSLREYALSKDKSKEKKSTYSITIGQSTVNPLLKLTIKKDMTVALFKMEDEYLKDIKRDASGDGTKIKVKETEVIISDAQACKAAKNMIDLREDQIERYNDLLKEQRAMNRKK